MILSFLLTVLIVGGLAVLWLYATKLDGEIVNKFENRRWDIPATVYSRPMTLTTDTAITGDNIQTWLSLLNYSKGNIDQTGSYQFSDNTFTIHTRGFDYGDGETDKPQLIKIIFNGGKVARIMSTEQNRDGVVRLEPIKIGGIYPENNEDRILINKDNVPQKLIDALISTEDRSFYEHYGVSIRGTTRALWANLRGGSTQGGSTITQQLIKNFYLTQDRTLKRKANEALMALLLERHYSKDAILLAYLNEINLGQNGSRSVNGFGIASQFYFNKPLGELRTDQYALLVGVAKGASYYNPRKHPERALNRRNTVLHNMLIMGKIDQDEYEKSIKQPLDVVKNPAIAKTQFPDFFDAINRELKQHYKQKDLQSAGLKIISTLDPIAQTAADKAFSTQLSKLQKSSKSTKNLQGALISADPTTGELVALVGSASDFTGFNRAIDAKRQVGSLLKPIIYLSAIGTGDYNLASGVKDEPIAYNAGGKEWTPKNYGGQSHGVVPLLDALTNSYNQAAVNVGMQFGLKTFEYQLKQLGINDDTNHFPSTLLGAIDLSPMQVLGMYQVFASGGYHTPIHSIKRVISDAGQVIQRTDDDVQTRVRIPYDSMYIINYAMQKVMTDGTAKNAASLASKYGLAGKTGTTNDARDAWFAGYSGNYVSVVWVGRDDNKPIGLTGGSGALPIWQDYMRRLNLTPVHFDKPKEVEWLWLQNGTGLRTEEGCQAAVYLPVLIKHVSPEYAACSDDGQMAEDEVTYGDVADTTEENADNTDNTSNAQKDDSVVSYGDTDAVY